MIFILQCGHNVLGTYNGEEYSLVITVRQSRLEYTSYRNVMYVLKTASYYIFCRSSYPLIDNVKEEREEPHHLTICEYAEIFHKKATKTSLARAGNRITTKEKALCLPTPPRNTQRALVLFLFVSIAYWCLMFSVGTRSPLSPTHALNA